MVVVAVVAVRKAVHRSRQPLHSLCPRMVVVDTRPMVTSRRLSRRRW